MNKNSITNFFKGIGNTVQKHSPEILTGIGITGMITTTVLAVKATPKAMDLIVEAESKKYEATDGQEELTYFELVKAGWKPYIPAIISGVGSIACIIGASSVNAKRNAALATAYKITETAFLDYKDKVIETIGEKKEEQVRKKVAQKQIDENPAPSKEVMIIGDNEVLCMEAISKRYFKSSIETIRKIINDLNADMACGEPYISLSQFYDAIGLPHTAFSDQMGWSLFKERQIEVTFDGGITEDGRPCVVVDFLARPTYDFDRLH